MAITDRSSSDNLLASKCADCARPPFERRARRQSGIWIVLLTLSIVVAGVGAATAATVTVSTERGGDAIDIHASALLNADTTTAWRVLTDYTRYTDFIPDLRVSRVISRKDARVIVEQSGDAALWVFKLPLDITFDVSEFPPTRLQSHATAGSLPVLDSTYTLNPAGTGVRLDYAGRVNTGYGWFGHIEQTAVEANIARQFKALVDEIERQDAASRSRAIAEIR